MTEISTLAVSRPRPGIALVEITREKSANTLSAQLCRELLQLVDRFAHDGTKVVVVTGRGRFFSAGADLRDPEHGPGWFDVCRRGLDAFAALPIPTIAAVNGVALGGGTELALACDFRIASDSAVMGLPEITFGSLPGGGGLSRLQRAVGSTHARNLVYTGRRVDAEEALRIGLVSRIERPDGLIGSVLDEAELMAAHARYALSAAKAVFEHVDANPGRSALPMEYLTLDKMATPEQMEEQRRVAAERSPTYAKIFAGQSGGDEQ